MPMPRLAIAAVAFALLGASSAQVDPYEHGLVGLEGYEREAASPDYAPHEQEGLEGAAGVVGAESFPTPCAACRAVYARCVTTCGGEDLVQSARCEQPYPGVVQGSCACAPPPERVAFGRRFGPNNGDAGQDLLLQHIFALLQAANNARISTRPSVAVEARGGDGDVPLIVRLRSSGLQRVAPRSVRQQMEGLRLSFEERREEVAELERREEERVAFQFQDNGSRVAAPVEASVEAGQAESEVAEAKFRSIVLFTAGFAVVGLLAASAFCCCGTSRPSAEDEAEVSVEICDPTQPLMVTYYEEEAALAPLQGERMVTVVLPVA